MYRSSPQHTPQHTPPHHHPVEDQQNVSVDQSNFGRSNNESFASIQSGHLPSNYYHHHGGRPVMVHHRTRQATGANRPQSVQNSLMDGYTSEGTDCTDGQSIRQDEFSRYTGPPNTDEKNFDKNTLNTSMGPSILGPTESVMQDQSVAYTAYTMNMESAVQIIEELRNVGVNVLSIDDRIDMLRFLDAVSVELPMERCLLYTDNLGRVFNVVVSGGSCGLNSAWQNSHTTFAGWEGCVALPFIARVFACPMSTIRQPLLLVLLFGFVLVQETSYCCISTSLFVQGTSSIGSYVWKSSALTQDYPRLSMLLILSMATFAPVDSSAQNILTLLGAGLGGIILAANLGARAWKKLNIRFIEDNFYLSHVFAFLAAVVVGLIFPYVGMRSVHGGGVEEGKATPETTPQDGPNADASRSKKEGRRSRQVITLASSFVAVLFIAWDFEVIQQIFGLPSCDGIGYLSLCVGIWWTLSTIASLSVCHQIDASEMKRLDPFLKRDETSPVGWIVPSLPNVVVDPTYRGGDAACEFLSFGSDILSGALVLTLGGLLMWQGDLYINGNSLSSIYSGKTD